MKKGSDPIVIVSAVRTAIGNFNGICRALPATQLGAAAISGAVARAEMKPDQIEEVLLGNVLSASLGQAPARQAAITAGLPKSTPATLINKVCGSGMKAVMLAHDEIVAGSNEIIVAGGMENMTRAPYLLPQGRFGARIGHSVTLDHMMIDGLEDAYTRGRTMGFYAEEAAKKFKISREDQDAFAHESVIRAKKATDEELFKDEIIPITIAVGENKMTLDKDEGPQRADPERIAELKPAFAEDGTITAANSSSIADGAAALVLMPESKAQEMGLKPLARIVGHYTHAQEPEWFTTAPAEAIKGLLNKISWKIKNVDLFEINEAFAVVTILAMNELKLDHKKVNVYGGSCVLGHPIGASGARIIVTLLNALKQQKAKTGVAALCIGGGEATAIAVELMS